MRRGKEINHSRRSVQTVFTSHHRRRDNAGLFVPAECPAEDQTWNLEEAVGLLATEQPALGQVRASNELRKRGIFISPCGVRCVWQRHDMETVPKRLAALEAKVAEEGLILMEAQVIAMKRKREKREASGEIETEHPGYRGVQNTYYVGNIKGVGRIYQQTFIDTCSKLASAKLYDRKNAITAADMLNDKVMPFFEEQEIPLLRMLTDRGTEYCGKPNITNVSCI